MPRFTGILVEPEAAETRKPRFGGSPVTGTEPPQTFAPPPVHREPTPSVIPPQTGAALLEKRVADELEALRQPGINRSPISHRVQTLSKFYGERAPEYEGLIDLLYDDYPRLHALIDRHVKAGLDPARIRAIVKAQDDEDQKAEGERLKHERTRNTAGITDPVQRKTVEGMTGTIEQLRGQIQRTDLPENVGPMDLGLGGAARQAAAMGQMREVMRQRTEASMLPDNTTTAAGAFTGEMLQRAAPLAAGLAVAPKAAALGAPAGPLGSLATALIGFGAAYAVADAAQRKAFELAAGPELTEQVKAYADTYRREHPAASVLGAEAANLAMMRPNPTHFREVLGAVKAVRTGARMTVPQTAALANIGGGAGVGGVMEGVSQIREGDLDVGRLATGIGMGAVLHEPQFGGKPLVPVGEPLADPAISTVQRSLGGQAMLDAAARRAETDPYKRRGVTLPDLATPLAERPGPRAEHIPVASPERGPSPADYLVNVAAERERISSQVTDEINAALTRRRSYKTRRAYLEQRAAAIGLNIDGYNNFEAIPKIAEAEAKRVAVRPQVVTESTERIPLVTERMRIRAAREDAATRLRIRGAREMSDADLEVALIDALSNPRTVKSLDDVSREAIFGKSDGPRLDEPTIETVTPINRSAQPEPTKPATLPIRQKAYIEPDADAGRAITFRPTLQQSVADTRALPRLPEEPLPRRPAVPRAEGLIEPVEVASPQVGSDIAGEQAARSKAGVLNLPPAPSGLFGRFRQRMGFLTRHDRGDATSYEAEIGRRNEASASAMRTRAARNDLLAIRKAHVKGNPDFMPDLTRVIGEPDRTTTIGGRTFTELQVEEMGDAALRALAKQGNIVLPKGADRPAILQAILGPRPTMTVDDFAAKHGLTPEEKATLQAVKDEGAPILQDVIALGREAGWSEGLLRHMEQNPQYATRLYMKHIMGDDFVPERAALDMARDAVATQFEEAIAGFEKRAAQATGKSAPLTDYLKTGDRKHLAGMTDADTQNALTLRRQFERFDELANSIDVQQGQVSVNRNADAIRNAAESYVDWYVRAGVDEVVPPSGMGSEVDNFHKRALEGVFRALYGEIKDPIFRLLKSREIQSHAAANLRAMSAVAEKGRGKIWSENRNGELGFTERLSSQPPSKGPTADDRLKYGVMAGRWVSKETKEVLTGLRRSQGDLMRVLGNVQAHQRNLQVGTSPRAHVRDYMGNVLGFAMQSGDALDPRWILEFGKAHKLLWRLLRGNAEAWRELAKYTEKGVFRSDMTSVVEDIQARAGANPHRFSSRFMGQIAHLVRPVAKASEKIAAARGYIDLPAKIAAYEAAIARGATEAEAIEHVARSYQNRDRIPEWVKKAGRIPMVSPDYGGFKYDSGRTEINALRGIGKAIADGRPGEAARRIAGFGLARAWGAAELATRKAKCIPLLMLAYKKEKPDAGDLDPLDNENEAALRSLLEPYEANETMLSLKNGKTGDVVYSVLGSGSISPFPVDELVWGIANTPWESMDDKAVDVALQRGLSMIYGGGWPMQASAFQKALMGHTIGAKVEPEAGLDDVRWRTGTMTEIGKDLAGVTARLASDLTGLWPAQVALKASGAEARKEKAEQAASEETKVPTGRLPKSAYVPSDTAGDVVARSLMPFRTRQMTPNDLRKLVSNRFLQVNKRLENVARMDEGPAKDREMQDAISSARTVLWAGTTLISEKDAIDAARRAGINLDTLGEVLGRPIKTEKPGLPSLPRLPSL